jgi:hypothetical protein
MNVKHLTPELLRGMRSASIPSAEQQDHLEVRLLTMYLTLSFINDLVGPITYIYQLTPSLLYKVASLSHGSWAVGVMFGAALVLALPHAVALIFFPRTLATRWPRKAATLAAVIVTVTWCYLAILSMPLDAGPLVWLYLRQAVESVGLAFLYAISLNAQLLRALYKVMHP